MATARAKERTIKVNVVPPRVIELLKSGSFDSNGVMTMPITKDRKLYTDTAKVLEALGGKWNKSLRGHVFDGDGETLVNDALATGSYIDPKKALQFFETPSYLADRMAVVADRLYLTDATGLIAVEDILKSGDRSKVVRERAARLTARVLEPSAGKGRIIEPLVGLGYHSITMVDINPAFVAELQGRFKDGPHNCEFKCADFTSLQPPTKEEDLYDLVVMNPPFTKGQDIEHVEHAFQFLRPGGGLVAITANGWHTNANNACRRFRDWFNNMGGYAVQLPDDAFKSSGTLVRTRLLAMRKPA